MIFGFRIEVFHFLNHNLTKAYNDSVLKENSVFYIIIYLRETKVIVCLLSVNMVWTVTALYREDNIKLSIKTISSGRT